MVFRSSRTWCYICRDERPDITCSEKLCKKSFHWDCLRNTGEFMENDDNGDPYLCSRCREDQESDSSSCDSRLYEPKARNNFHEKRSSENTRKSSEQQDDSLSDKDAVQSKVQPDTNGSCEAVKSTLVNIGGGKPKLGNVDICYVCQKGGKLLCCDLCDQSYHPKCIDSEFLDPIVFDASGKWGCPICQGKDPLKNMSHKRMTKRERQEKSDLWQKCIARESRRCRANRNKFLYSCRNVLEPFVSSDILTKIKKDAARSVSKEFLAPKRRRSEIQILSETSQPTSKSGIPSSSDTQLGPCETQFASPCSSSTAKLHFTDANTSEKASSKESSVLYREESLWKEVEARAALSEYELLSPGVQLKPYQIWGVNWLLDAFSHKAGAILADEMGLGKTIQTLAFLSALKALDISGPHLIVVPLSTVGNWIREVRAFTPSLSVTKICGSRQEREHSMMDGVASAGIYDLFVTTYETVVTEEWFFTDRFQWQCVVLDEAHRIKNDNARMRHSLDRVKCNMRVLLTGTPLQNNVKELFTLLNFLFPEVIKSSKVIETIFSVSQKKKNITTNQRGSALMIEEELIDPTVLDKEKVNALTFLLSKLMLRRTKDLVVKLPAKIEYDIWLPLSAQAGLWYKRLLELTATTTDDTTSLRKLLGAVVKIRICCCHPRGLVSREAQLQNLIQTFRDSGWSEEDVEAVQKDAETLKKEAFGLNHIRCSSKLTFLDKLLRQLHAENMDLCPDYKNEFLKSYDNRLRQEINSRTVLLDSLDSGRVNSNVSAERLQKEVEILNTPLEKGGGLPGLQKFIYGDDFSYADEYHLMAKYTYPAVSDLPEEKLENPRPHKVLVFTQFQLVLDELSAYCTWRGWRYMRLDGSTNKMIRELDTREFNSPDSTHFVYLISTRAGGLGINLVTANHVVMYDEDWNPFVDLQAVDRAHRIGQLRHVHVWRLITEWTIEERMALRRQQKLRLDKMLIQANVQALECDENTSFHEKLSSEEVRRLLQYGRTALLEAHFTNEIEYSSLERILQRKRRDLKELEEEKLRLWNENEASDEEKVDTSALMQEWNTDAVSNDEQSEALFSPDLNIDCLLDSPKNCEKEQHIEQQDSSTEYTLYHRPQRLRRRPAVTYNPVVHSTKIHIERRVLRERRCFRCDGGGPPIGSKACEKGQFDPLVGCMRCPKVYHLNGCLGLTEVPPKSWMCPWHECCLCFRRAGNCGGLLIHCIECPTAFCFDCFPPEYRRYEPPPFFFENLQKRGWNVTPKKLVTFLCSKCKALKEQERRRHLSKEQLEDEMKSRRVKDSSARQDAKKQQQTRDQRALAKEERQKEADAKKQFSKQKKKLDDYDKQLQQDLRTAIDALYPHEYLRLIDARRQRLVESHQHVLSPSQEQSKAPNETIQQDDTQDPDASKIDSVSAPSVTESDNKLDKEYVRKRDHSMILRPSAPHLLDLSHKKRLVIPDRLKRPGETLKLCENCHFPLHDLTQCPFPLEFCRFRVDATSSTTEVVPDLDKGDSSCQNLKDAECSKLGPSKVKFRTVCSLCKSVTKLHGRRHCNELDPKEKDKYTERREQYEKLVSLLKQRKQQEGSGIPLQPRFQSLLNCENPSDQTVTDKVLDSVRRQLNYQLYMLLSEFLKEVGLEQCNVAQITISEPPTTSESEKKESKSSRKKISKSKGTENRKFAVCTSNDISDVKVESVKQSTTEPSKPLTSSKKRKVEQTSPVTQETTSQSSLTSPKCYSTAKLFKTVSNVSEASAAPKPIAKNTNLTKPKSKTAKSSKTNAAQTSGIVAPTSTTAAPISSQPCSQPSLPQLYNVFNPRSISTNVRALSQPFNNSFNSAAASAYQAQPASQNDMMVTAALFLNAQQSSDLSKPLRIPSPGVMSHACLPHPSAFWTALPQPTRSVVSCLNSSFSPSINTVDLLSRKPNFFFNTTSPIRPRPDFSLNPSNENVVEIELDSELT